MLYLSFKFVRKFKFCVSPLVKRHPEGFLLRLHFYRQKETEKGTKVPNYQIMGKLHAFKKKIDRGKSPGYRFTKGLTQNLNLRTNLKLKYNIKSLDYIQPNLRFQASFLYYWTMSFTFSTWSVV